MDYGILGLFGDNGKDNGNYYLGLRVQELPACCAPCPEDISGSWFAGL